MLKQMNRLLFGRSKRIDHPLAIIWLALALVVCSLYPILGFLQVSGENYWIQDDARQHIFWMMRFVEPESFANNLIADYFQFVSPVGVQWLYKGLSSIGINPIEASKFMPLPLSLITAFFCFLLTLEIFPIPFTAFVATSLLSQNLWMQNGLVSGTAKALYVPFFLGFLWSLAKKNILGSCIFIALVSLFYPPFALVASGILIFQCFTIKEKKIQINNNKKDNIIAISGLVIAFVLLLPEVLIENPFAPVISLQKAQEMSIFHPGQRASFFSENIWDYIFNGRSGLRITSALMPELTYISLLFPIIVIFKKEWPLKSEIQPSFVIIKQLLASSLILFFTSHLLLIKLYLPSRYSSHSLRVIIAVTSAIMIGVLFEKIVNSQVKKKYSLLRQISIALVCAFLFWGLLVKPFVDEDFPFTGYVIGNYPKLYEFIQETPIDSTIASLLSEADNIPSFASRSVYIAQEYGIPYHDGYYEQFSQQVGSLLLAHYTLSLDSLKRFIQDSSIDFWVISNDVFESDFLQSHKWLNNFQPEAKVAYKNLNEESSSIALKKLQDKCLVFQEKDLKIIDSKCILKTPKLP